MERSHVVWWLLLMTSALAVQVPLEFPEHDPVTAMQGLVSRRFGLNYVYQFSFETIPPSETGNDVAIVEMKDDLIRIAGSSATAMGYALHTYLKDVVRTQVNWDNHALKLPPVLPPVPKPFSIAKATKYTYYLNICTHSYSMWTWDWTQWETHIDWMVLNGINMPLAITGQEKTWQKTFEYYNVSKSGLERFFGGAAFLAWERMGNIRGDWSPLGRLPQHFIDRQHELQLQLLERYREFGMLPALPAFAGHVPEEMHVLFPNASMRKSDQWAGFDLNYTCVYMLDPTDPLYLEVGKKFLTIQRELYGGYTSSLYSTDTYNELKPHTSDHEYLRASSKAVIDSMIAADKKAVWIMQAWLFISMRDYWTQDKIEAYLSGVPNDRMIILDLYSEESPYWAQTSNYYGKPWIYCVLHTFGGNLGMHGNLPRLSHEPLEALAKSDGRMIGMGLTMEGIFQNYIVYDFSLEMNWQSQPRDVAKYVERYAQSRYHIQNDEIVQKGWKDLIAAVYSGDDKRNSLMTFRPNMQMLSSILDLPIGNVSLGKTATKSVHSPWLSFLKAAAASPRLASTDSFLHDLVDIVRQGLSDLMSAYYHEFMVLYSTPATTTPTLLRSKADQILDLIKDCDRILASHNDYLLGRWIADAKRWQHGDDVSYFEFEARIQITKWSVRDNFNDYARKEWAGVMGDYYHGRWKIFLDGVVSAFSKKTPVDMNTITDAIRTFELGWIKQTKTYPVEGTGDAVALSKELYEKYKPKMPQPSGVWSQDLVSLTWFA
ncbi:alpha-N-acetylglucosaminidase (NAGLU) [Thraustotheca clavata]|uniref:Alpha-N-acetylglucosaminidase (NAGLU) n=1 Tax=Thraustotheca clavata TaxID=74557 RepID=A0A0A7CMU6_9STRA|nr:secreted protein [Thraustotheca clavata]OQR81892.1 alpha-N-acetylglucosaminidase (NAGLU) [Thraustotheca clavata]